MDVKINSKRIVEYLFNNTLTEEFKKKYIGEGRLIGFCIAPSLKKATAFFIKSNLDRTDRELKLVSSALAIADRTGATVYASACSLRVEELDGIGTWFSVDYQGGVSVTKKVKTELCSAELCSDLLQTVSRMLHTPLIKEDGNPLAVSDLLDFGEGGGERDAD